MHLRCDDPRLAARAAAVRRRHILLATVALLAAIALAVPWGTKPDGALAAPMAARTGSLVSAHGMYVVRAGDSVISIARRIDPQGPSRSVVRAIRAQVGSGDVRPGERLVLP